MKPIGNYLPKNQYLLAPMEAVNCTAFRELCLKRGAGLVYTDMIDADVYCEYQGDRIKKFVNPSGNDLAVQIGGSNIQNLITAINELQDHAVLIDYNIGCPLGYMLGKKGGAYLSKHPDQLYKIIKSLRANCKIPLTVKMRSGWDEKSLNAHEIVVELEKLGVDAITLHPRTRKQGYRNKADWNYARKVRELIKIPFILSGDVINPYMALKAFQHVKPDYVMIARGAQKCPSIFKNLKNIDYKKNNKDTKHDFLDFLKLYKKYENYSISQLRDYALWFSTECKDNKKISQKILISNEDQLIQIISHLKFIKLINKKEIS